MALGDITIYGEGAFGYPGSTNFATATATAQAIKAGEPVAKALAGTVVTALATSKPVVGTDYLAGIAATSSTETATLTGTVQVTKMTDGVTYLIAPKTAASWDTQAEYDALVGARVTFDLTTGVYTINATDASGNGLVVEPLDISKYPGKVRFSIRNGASYLA
jgi:hypothetical protein